jgi:hypothetical protein
MKICSRCRKTKSFDLFYKSSSRKDGLQRFCKECTKTSNLISRTNRKKLNKENELPGQNSCGKCGLTKSSDQFAKNLSGKDGLNWCCKSCDNTQKNSLLNKNKIRQNVVVPYVKKCWHCKKIKKSNEFFRYNGKSDGLNSACKECDNNRYVSERVAVFNALGGVKCVRCNITEIKFLTVQHINNDGKEHRIHFNPRGLYRDILLNSDKSKYEVLCICCNKEDYLKHLCIESQNLKKAALETVCNGVVKCSCNGCGETALNRLCIDHKISYKTDNEGPRSGPSLYKWITIKKSTFIEKFRRKSKFQVLCHNCNMAKGTYSYCIVHTNTRGRNDSFNDLHIGI